MFDHFYVHFVYSSLSSLLPPITMFIPTLLSSPQRALTKHGKTKVE